MEKRRKMETVRNKSKLEFFLKDDNETNFKQQSKLPFIDFHTSYTGNDNYTFKQNDVLMNKPTHLKFAVLQLSKLYICESYYDKIQTYFS